MDKCRYKERHDTGFIFILSIISSGVAALLVLEWMLNL